jgi:hypothetical protein
MKLADAALDFNQLENIAAPNFQGGSISTFLTGGGGSFGLITIFFFLAGVLFLFYFMWGGFQMMQAKGDPKGVQSAKNKLTNAAIGFIIVFSAYWLVQAIGLMLGAESITNTFGG